MRAGLIAISAALGLLSSAALAADLPNTKGPPAFAPPPPPAFSWTGFYVGGEIGARWSDPTWSTTCLSPGFAGVVCPGAPSELPLFGFNNPENFDSVSVKGGPFVGYNFQIGSQWVVGVEGDWQYGENRRTNTGIPGAENPAVAGSPGLDSSTVREDWDASIRARAGFLVMPNLLVFGTGGAAFTHVSATALCGTAFPIGWCVGIDPFFGIPQTSSATRVGWTVGGGLEYMIAPNWLIRAEYRYADYGSFSSTFFSGVLGNEDAISFNTRLRSNTASVGLSYKFDMFAPPAPVVAKY
jgi:outer membrane immunogenic protein